MPSTEFYKINPLLRVVRLRCVYVQVPKDKEELAALQARLRKRFPVDAYNKARRELDPNRILSNNMLEKLFPDSITI